MKINRDKRTWLTMLGIFVVMFGVTFLIHKINDRDVDAVNMGAFDPGYIISDYQMGNYNSMNEGQIQAFLKSKNSCNDTATWKSGNNVGYLSENAPYSWHIENGHYVCMADENFNGESAAHIIWQAAQDYRINPKVLIVLLQKEQGLVTDTFPNSVQYRSAMGYGCPDTAACSTQYYGFRNQVRNAAALFRTVLDGGWTNYPVGNNYVRYSPNAACGGTTVNIRNRATSALYRYTPYQPNAAALSSSYGGGDGCSAYGNRNFYSYFEDWFGGIKGGISLIGSYENMSVPRLMFVESGDRYIEPKSGDGNIRTNTSFEYFANLSRKSGELCLSLSANKNCYVYSDLDEITHSETTELTIPRMLTVKNNTKTIDADNKKFGNSVTSGQDIIFKYKEYINGRLCLKQEIDSDCIQYVDLKELPSPIINNMKVPRELFVKPNAELIDIKTGISETVSGGKKLYFEKASTWKGKLCLQARDYKETYKCIVYEDSLMELNRVSFEDMTVSRYLIVKNNNTYAIDINSWGIGNVFDKNKKMFFDKRLYINGKLCLGASEMPANQCILYSELTEAPRYDSMVIPRYLWTKESTAYYNTLSHENGDILSGIIKGYFTEKIVINNKLCLRTQEDSNNGIDRCLWYSDLREE